MLRQEALATDVPQRMLSFKRDSDIGGGRRVDVLHENLPFPELEQKLDAILRTM